VQAVVEAVRVGNLYVNRNQIGAVVGSQPFGGEGLSGTGPKAGGPDYVPRLAAPRPRRRAGRTGGGGPRRISRRSNAWLTEPAPQPWWTHDLPGPTGESNRLRLSPRAPVLCLGPGTEAEAAQVEAVRMLGGRALAAGGTVPPTG
jgi:RHH-type transcriptional regulator, proline utilization regulon repressor / proline dehydrogenase / delta 1-pyrroline-5-carboxylate dehydrogenase